MLAAAANPDPHQLLGASVSIGPHPLDGDLVTGVSGLKKARISRLYIARLVTCSGVLSTWLFEMQRHRLRQGEGPRPNAAARDTLDAPLPLDAAPSMSRASFSLRAVHPIPSRGNSPDTAPC